VSAKKRGYRFCGSRGFTLVELMVVVSIMAILASVAIPGYINYVNRAKQGEAAAMLMTARLEMEEYYTDVGRYANTIQCLPSFVTAGNTACLANCSACASNSSKPKFYTYSIAQPVGTLNYQIGAARKIYSWAATDVVNISANTDSPMVVNTDALKFSIFQWLFP
jgi:prepilin-type N-terminal cleavage/methylation domain-containing protein